MEYIPILNHVNNVYPRFKVHFKSHQPLKVTLSGVRVNQVNIGTKFYCSVTCANA